MKKIYTELGDTELLKIANTGFNSNEALDAFGEIYSRYRNRVLSLLRQKLESHGYHDFSEAENMCQDIWIKIQRVFQRSDFREDEGIMALLHTSVSNKVFDFLRAKHTHVRRFSFLDDSGDEFEDHETNIDKNSPDSIAISHESFHFGELAPIIELLQDEEKKLLQLRYQDGLSDNEIATQLQIALGTVKSRIRRALIAIRKQMIISKLDKENFYHKLFLLCLQEYKT